MIAFGTPTVTGNELEYLRRVLSDGRFSGDCAFTQRCHRWLEEKTRSPKALLTTSGTSALEMAALLIDIQAGDEVIMPSYTFPSTANAFVLRGARVVFVDIRPDTMNLDERLIEGAITERTKAIVPVHYAGVACEMDTIVRIARGHNLHVIEDAAQGLMAYYKGRMLGAIGDMGCYSFHETKNYQCGEGGCLLLNEERYRDRAEIIREKGTNRSKYFRGEIDKYNWQDVGSSFLPSELNAAFLYAQLEAADDICEARLKSWKSYFGRLGPLADDGLLELPRVPEECQHNAHMFYIKVKNLTERTALLEYLKTHGVMAASHYVPLHSAPAGMKFGRFCGEDRFTRSESERLIRLPLYYRMSEDDVGTVSTLMFQYFEQGRRRR
jgi:dTDP-4-amino-4,6-dideoxygalactose transaminase